LVGIAFCSRRKILSLGNKPKLFEKACSFHRYLHESFHQMLISLIAYIQSEL